MTSTTTTTTGGGGTAMRGAGASRHRFELIRDLANLLATRMSGQGHLLQSVQQEGRGNCLNRKRICTDACKEAQRLLAEAAPFMAQERPAPQPLKPLPQITLRRVRAPRRIGKPEESRQLALLLGDERPAQKGA